ncbi:DUF1801 domain-containing protein [Metabacillus halosaccharovorans]|uniref:DUF1801 domain-containing protein n=1 Tax=Metabacillus halosaccharovorans TaxID=930124 RepID=UPI00203FC62C|nr:DUF1801 domain-containing protein [Metabacillus halosaccharovorans]MCM3443850.1 DUF1801 domain-containing protein [Metabacillus halosaccharovorans]
MNQEVTDFINSLDEPWQLQLCDDLREVVHRAIPEVQERMQYKKPHFLKHGKYAVVISTSKKAVSFTIFNTTNLEIPTNFDGPSERKTLKILKGEKPDFNQLISLVQFSSSNL